MALIRDEGLDTAPAAEAVHIDTKDFIHSFTHPQYIHIYSKFSFHSLKKFQCPVIVKLVM